jgi:hypothetical protein
MQFFTKKKKKVHGFILWDDFLIDVIANQLISQLTSIVCVSIPGVETIE